MGWGGVRRDGEVCGGGWGGGWGGVAVVDSCRKLQALVYDIHPSIWRKVPESDDRSV